jgi:hypothetical protein
LFRVFLVAFAACNRQTQPVAAVPSASCAPPPSSAQVDALVNDTPLRTEPVDTPTSSVQLTFRAPELGERIATEGASAYLVRLVSSAAQSDALGVDVALDAQRPHRLAAPVTEIALARLLSSPDAELAPGAHWLFAAPVLASGLVPRPAPGQPRAAIARRFFIGKVAEAAGPSGAVWLRKPEGTYNGAKNADSVLFDAYAFSATGALLDPPCTIAIAGITGKLRLPAPFSVLSVASGEYEVTVSSATAPPVTSRFTVNRELGGVP